MAYLAAVSRPRARESHKMPTPAASKPENAMQRAGRPPAASKPDDTKVNCRKAGEKRPMVRILVARRLYEPSSLFCHQCNNNVRCSNKT